MKNNIKNATFGRLNGLAVVISPEEDNFGRFVLVRYCGPEGKQIRTDRFLIDSHELTEY